MKLQRIIIQPLCITLLLFMIISNIQAQNISSTQQWNSKLSHFKQYPIMRYHFIQEKKIAFLSKPLISKGHITFAQSKGLYLEYVEPIWTAYLLIENNIFEKTTKKGHYQKLNFAANTGISQVLKAIISVDFEKLKTYFNIDFEQIDKEWKISLQPLKSNSKNSLKKIVITGQYVLNTLTLFEFNGDSSILRFSVSKNGQQALSANEKQFFKY